MTHLHRPRGTVYPVQPWIGALVFCCSGCAASTENADRPLARAYDQVLYWSDLRQVVPMEYTPEDSAALASQFIDGWLRQQVVLHIAESNLANERISLAEQMEDYRRSLVIFNYEQALVEQKLDTVVTAEQISAYYEAHQVNFELKDEIVRARWFKVNEPDKRVVRRMEERFLGGTNEQLHELELWLAASGVHIMDRSTTWVPGTDLRSEIPMSEIDAKAVMARTGKHVLRYGNAAWFVEILDLRQRASRTPLELVRQDIRAILLNQRKLQLIGDMRKHVYEQAMDKKDVEVYAQ